MSVDKFLLIGLLNISVEPFIAVDHSMSLFETYLTTWCRFLTSATTISSFSFFMFFDHVGVNEYNWQ